MKSNVRFMYLRDNRGNPIGCLAIRLLDRCRSIDYQYSVLNPVDSFKRDVARDLATGRLNNNPYTIEAISRFDNMHHVTSVVMSDLAYSESAPKRARKAALLWLANGY